MGKRCQRVLIDLRKEEKYKINMAKEMNAGLANYIASKRKVQRKFS